MPGVGRNVNTYGMVSNDTMGIMADDVGERLKQARKARGFSRAVVAERMRVTEAAIQHHESGKNDPSLPLLAKYARIYRISTDWIIMGKGKGPTDARDPREAVLEVWDGIAPTRQPQALAVLQTFLPQEKQSA